MCAKRTSFVIPKIEIEPIDEKKESLTISEEEPLNEKNEDTIKSETTSNKKFNPKILKEEMNVIQLELDYNSLDNIFDKYASMPKKPRTFNISENFLDKIKEIQFLDKSKSSYSQTEWINALLNFSIDKLYKDLKNSPTYKNRIAELK